MNKFCKYYSRKLPSGKIAHCYREKNLSTGAWKRFACPDYVQTKKDADAFIAIREADLIKQARSIDDGVPVRTTAEKVMTLKAFLEWDRERTDIAESTRYSEKSMAKHLIAGLGENVRVAELTSSMIDDYVRMRQQQKKKPRTINLQLQMLKAALNRGVEKHKLSRVPCKFKKLPEPPSKTRTLSQKEAAALLEAILKHDRELEPEKFKNPDSAQKRLKKQKLHDVVSALLHSGLRKSELFSLRWQHVDLRHETVTVTCLKRGGGGEGHTDTLPMFPEFAQILRRLYAETKPSPDELIFGIDSTERGKILNGAKPSKRGTVAGRDCFADYRLLSKLKRYAAFAKIDWADSLTIHDLRHTFCTELARTTSLAVVKDFARHKDISTTLRYVHPAGMP